MRGFAASRLATLALLAVLVLVSVPAVVEEAKDVDVLLYMAAAAKANAAGAPPYVAAWIEKGPLAMGVFQALALAFGRYPMPAVALFGLACSAAAMLLVRAIAREIGAGEWGALAGAAAFAVSVGAVGGTPNTEVPAAVAAAAAVLLWLRDRRPVLVGLCVAAAFLCRQNAGLLWAILAALELRRHGPRRAIELTAGFVLPVGLVALGYAAIGEWKAFLFCFWGYNRDVYIAATHVSAGRILRSPIEAWSNFFRPTLSASIAGAAGILLAILRRDRKAIVVAGVAVGTTLSLWPGLRFFSHYFALALPFWAALGGYALGKARGRPAVAAWAALAVVAGWQGYDRGWHHGFERAISRTRNSGLRAWTDPLYWPGRDGLAAEVAAFLRERAGPDDRVFVWGKRPHVVVYSGLVPATHFVTCTFLTGLVPWERVAPSEDTTRWIVPGAWDLLEADLDRERPRFIVDASHDHMFGGGAYAPDRFPRLAERLERDYVRIGEFGTGDRMAVWELRDVAQAP